MDRGVSYGLVQWQLRKLCGRQLKGLDIAVLLLDGKSFGSSEMVIGLGVSADGRKIPLGFIQTGAD